MASSTRPPARPSALPPLDAPLENEEEVLDAYVSTLSRQAIPAESWYALSKAATRDGRVDKLAFAWETVAHGKRVRTLLPAEQAEFYFRAGEFFVDVLGDEVGAIAHFEKALTTLSAHEGAFARLEDVLARIGDAKKLADWSLVVAPNRPLEERAALLRRSAMLYEQVPGHEEQAIEVTKELLKLDPTDQRALEGLEERYLRANRFRDLSKLYEQMSATDPPPPEEEAIRLRTRLVELYGRELQEPERALPHAEFLLGIDPSHEEAKKLCERLLVIKSAAARAASALATAADALGQVGEVLEFLAFELSHTRGPRRKDVLFRIGLLKQDQIGDFQGALEAYEQALAADPSDDALRARYGYLAGQMLGAAEAAKRLQRAGTASKEARVRSRIAAEVADLYDQGGDTRRARMTWVSLLTMPDADPQAILSAARHLVSVYEAENDPQNLCDVLERVAQMTEDAAERQAAEERFAEVATHELVDVPRAITAWTKLLETDARPRALAALEPLYEETNNLAELGWVLRERAKDADDEGGDGARPILFRAAEILTSRARDVDAAVHAWLEILERFGPDRDVYAHLLPLLEAQKAWPELAAATRADAERAPKDEQAALYARLGQLYTAHLHDIGAALDAFRVALEIDPKERTSRAALDKALIHGEHQTLAAEALEPILRRDLAEHPEPGPERAQAAQAMLRVLDVRADRADVPTVCLIALDEATELAEANFPERALEYAGRGLAVAARSHEGVAYWLGQVEALANKSGDVRALANNLRGALGERPVEDQDDLILAKRTAAAHQAIGDVAVALDFYRRALAFDTSSQELLQRVDELLEEQGNPEERVALYRAALERSAADKGRKRELLHAIGQIERTALANPDGAIFAYRAALRDDSQDRAARDALIALYTEISDWEELTQLLEAQVADAGAEDARKLRVQLAELSTQHGSPGRAREHAVALLESEGIGETELLAALAVADATRDDSLERAVLERRAELAEDPTAEAAAWEAVGLLLQTKLDEPGGAIVAFKRAAEAATRATDDEAEERLHQKVLAIANSDVDSARFLAGFYERRGAFAEVPRLYRILEAAETDTAARVALLLKRAEIHADALGDLAAAFEPSLVALSLAPTSREVALRAEQIAAAAGDYRRWIDALDDLQRDPSLDPGARLDFELAKARALTALGDRDGTTALYRAVLSSADLDEGRAHSVRELYEAHAAGAGSSGSPETIAEDTRWLYEWRIARASEDERASLLLEWARDEEERFGSLPRALALHRRVAEEANEAAEPSALASITRLALATGDIDGAVASLESRRERADGGALDDLELELAGILVERANRPRDALETLGGVLERTPSDPVALELVTKLIAIPETKDGALKLLEGALASAQDVSSRIEILGRLLEARPDAPPNDRESWYADLIDALTASSREASAFEIVLQATRERPERVELWERAESLSRVLGTPEPIAELYQDVLRTLEEREIAIELGQRAIAFLEEWFDATDGVIGILERILELDVKNAWAFDRLKLIYDSAERWNDLFALYDRSIAAASGSEKAALLEDVAQIAKDFANESDRAIAYLEELLALKPKTARLIAALERLYERQGRHKDLVGLLGAGLADLKPGEANAQRARIARLWLSPLGDATSALVVIEDLLADEERREGSGADVHSGANELVALLERVLALAAPDAELPEEVALEIGRRESPELVASPTRYLVRQRAANLLRERYAAAGGEADLVRVLEVELEAATVAKERVRRHLQIVDLYLHLDEEGSALDHLVALVLLEPDVAAHRERLEKLAAKTAKWDRFASVLVTAADDCLDDRLKVTLWMHAARVFAAELGEPSRAIELAFRVLDHSPVADDQKLDASRLVEPLLDAAGRREERLEVLERIALLEVDSSLRHEALGEAARLAIALGEVERAIDAWERRLEERPQDRESLDGLVTSFGNTMRWAELIGALKRRAEISQADARRADRVRIARLLSDELGKVDEAIDAWKRIETEFGENDETSEALGGLLRSAGEWRELAKLLARAAEREETSERTAALFRELGDVQREHLRECAEAVKSYEKSLANDPRNAASRAGLTELLATEEQRADAVRVLLDAHRTTEEWREVLALTEHRLGLADTDGERITILQEAAKLAEERVVDLPIALGFVRRAFAMMPGDRDKERELFRLAETTGDFQSLADALHDAVRAHDDEPRNEAWVSALRFRLGEVNEHRRDDPKGALAAYARVATEAPADLVAAASTIRTAGRIGRWDAAAKALGDSSRLLNLIPAALVACVEEAATLANGWDGPASALAQLVRDGGFNGTLSREFEALLASWHRDRRRDPDAAEAAFARALSHEPMNADLLAELTRLQRRAKGRPLIDSLLRLSQATGGDLDLLTEASDIAANTVRDRALAKSILDKLYRLGVERWQGPAGSAPTLSSPSLDGDDDIFEIPSAGSPRTPDSYVQHAQAELVRLHEEEGDLARVSELLEDGARLPFPRERTREMRLRAADIADERLLDAERAILLYTELFDEDPHDGESIGRLVALFQRTDRRRELLALTERRITVATSLDERLDLRLDAAELQDLDSDTRGAIEKLRQNLNEVPRHPRTVSELVRLLEREQEFAELEALYAEQAELAQVDGEDSLAADLFTRAAEVAEREQGALARAREHLRRVILLEPRNEALDAIARVALALHDPHDAAATLELLRAATAGAERANVTLRLADALILGGREDAARQRLEEESELAPSAEDVRERLGAIYREREDFEPLARLLVLGAEHALDKQTRLERLEEAAKLYRQRSGRPDLAIPLLEQAAELEPDQRELKLSLADALSAAERFDDARNLLRSLIDGFGNRRPKERAPVHYHMARLDLAVGDRAHALVELDAATRIDPANAEILRMLAELARDDGQLDRAERSYRALLTVLRRQETTDESAPVVKTEVLLALRSIARAGGAEDRAQEILESALEVARDNDVEARRLEVGLRAEGDHPSLVRALELRIGRGGPPELKADLELELGELYVEVLDRKDEGLGLLLRAIESKPTHERAHQNALSAARSLGQVNRYIDTLRGRLEALEESPSDSSILFQKLAIVLEEDEDDLGGAVEALESATSRSPTNASAFAELDRLLAKIGDREKRIAILRRRLGLVRTKEEGESVRYDLAKLLLEDVDTLEEGVTTLKGAIDTADDKTLGHELVKVAARAHPESREVALLYEEAAEKTGDRRSLIDALVHRHLLPSAEDAPLRSAVELANALPDGEFAEQLLRRYLERGTDDPGARIWALVTLSVLRAEAGDVSEAVLLKREAAELEGPAESRALLLEVARLARDVLVDRTLAILTLEDLFEKSAGGPENRDIWEPLLALYREQGEPEKLVALLASITDTLDDEDEKRKFNLERVQVRMEKLGDAEGAEEELRQIVDDDPDQVDAALLMAAIYERQGRDSELVKLLERQLDAAKSREDADAAASVAIRLGAVWENEDVQKAKQVYLAALEWKPKDDGLLRALVRVHERGGPNANHERAEAMERLLATLASDEAEQLATSLAELQTRLENRPGALRALELGYERCPASDALRDSLEKVYEEGGSWEKLARLYHSDAAFRSDATQRVARLRSAADLYRDKLDSADVAAQLLREAREIAPDDYGILRDLVQNLSIAGELDVAVLELSRELHRMNADDDRRIPLLAERAALRSRLEEDDPALADWEEAAAHDPRYIGELAISLGRVADRARETNSDTYRSLALRHADALVQTGDIDTARARVTDVLKVDPKDVEALRILARLDESAGAWDAASATYRRLVALEETPEAVVETAVRLADACEKAGRLADARGGLERARLVAPGNTELRALLERVYEAAGAHRELAELYLEDAKGSLDVGGRFGNLLRAGSLLLQSGNDYEAALAPLEEARALRPNDLDCVALLADAYTEVGRYAEAAEVLQGCIAQFKGRRARELSTIHHRLARVAEALGDRAMELTSLHAAFDVDGQNGVIASELAYVAMELGEWDLATRALRAITMLKNQAPVPKALAYQHLGEIARHQGDARKALVLLKRAIDEDPHLDSAKALLEQLKLEQ